MNCVFSIKWHKTTQCFQYTKNMVRGLRWHLVSDYFFYCEYVSFRKEAVTTQRFQQRMLCSSAGDCWIPTAVGLVLGVVFADPEVGTLEGQTRLCFLRCTSVGSGARAEETTHTKRESPQTSWLAYIYHAKLQISCNINIRPIRGCAKLASPKIRRKIIPF